MKNLLSLLAVTMAIVACEKQVDDAFIPSEAPSSTLERIQAAPEDAYLGNRVKTLMLGLLDLSKDTDFVNIVNQEVALQFDDDDNVLFKKLDATCALQGMNLAEELGSSVGRHQNTITSIGHDYDRYTELTAPAEITNILNGFEWNGYNYFLQLYIPFVDEVDLSAPPVICFGHQEVERTIGFKLNSQGEVEVLEVDEAYAEEHLVWVVSINEVVNDRGELPAYVADTSSTAGTGGPRLLGRSAKVSQVFVNDRKESWLKGKGEISIVGAVLKSWCSYEVNLPRVVLAKVSKREEGSWKNISPNTSGWIFADGWPSDMLANDERICFIMYEKDVHGSQSEAPCTGVSAMRFKSQNTMYGIIRSFNASWFPSSTTTSTTQVTSWTNAGVRVQTRAWY